ncbi:MAG: beta-N-acetylhexosaminidase [Myxococcota bacterium]
MTATERLSVTCGQLLVGGYLGERPPDTFLDALRRGHRAGAILFKRNLPSWEVGHAACAQLVNAAGNAPPLLGVDQEGGRVQRFGPPVLQVPSMRSLAGVRDPSLVFDTARELGTQLRDIGFNIDFAPVLDVDTNPNNPVIGDRSFSRDPEEVARLGTLWLQGLQEAGIAACGKHFPGHGDTSVDSHLELPTVETSVERLHAVELVPFRAAVAAGVDAIMSAHIVVRSVTKDVPATLSPVVMGGWLRDEMQFDGVIFSDDLEMHAIADRYEVGGAAVQAVRAGCDLLLICKSERWQNEAHTALVKEAERDGVFRARCEEAAVRSRRLRAKRPPRPVSDLAQLWARFEAAQSLQARLERL